VAGWPACLFEDLHNGSSSSLSTKPYCGTKVRRHRCSLCRSTDMSSCLYHTINILLHRATFDSYSQTSSSSRQSRQASAAECASSANDIVTIFDLFRRTFGLGFVILSLGYSIYTAVSIFLLEEQSKNRPGSPMSDRLAYCIEVLESIQDTSPSKWQSLDLRPLIYMLMLGNSCRERAAAHI
jgi:hypothetical protein